MWELSSRMNMKPLLKFSPADTGPLNSTWHQFTPCWSEALLCSSPGERLVEHLDLYFSLWPNCHKTDLLIFPAEISRAYELRVTLKGFSIFVTCGYPSRPLLGGWERFDCFISQKASNFLAPSISSLKNKHREARFSVLIDVTCRGQCKQLYLTWRCSTGCLWSFCASPVVCGLFILQLSVCALWGVSCG